MIWIKQQFMRLIAPTAPLPRNELVENPFPVPIHWKAQLNIKILVGDCERLKTVDSREAAERGLCITRIDNTI